MSYSYADKTLPARRAMILWNPGPAKDGDGRVMVVQHPQARDCPHRDLLHSDGACSAGWADPSDEVMLTKIQSLAWYIAREYGIDAKALHAALLEIDLYRKFWNG